jgi:hypothetical protein
MSVLPLYPLYPKPNFMEYNVSLSIPGINLWSLPGVGNCIKGLEYPNTKSLLLVPDIEYIKKFATYDLGIADMILKASLSKNLSRTKDPNLQSTFNKIFKQSNLPGAGLKSLEKTLISSIFESYKPYFAIAQMFSETIIDLEDIIARIAILTSPMIAVKPLKIKSRKPVGNSGNFGTPTAMGYKNGKIIKESISEFKRISKKGLDIKINDDGKSLINSKGPKISIGEDTKFDYITISTVYSTGVFKDDVKYNYRYIDIEEEPEPTIDPNESVVESDKRPDVIILGVFDSSGSSVDPNQYKLSWITKSPKWILNKSTDNPNLISWKIIDNSLYHWRRFGKVKIQKDRPKGIGWEKLKYKDVINFNLKNNENLKYKEDDYIVSFKSNDLNDYQKFFDSELEDSLKDVNLSKDQKELVRSEIKKIYNGPSESQPGQTLISEYVQNMVQFSKLKNSTYINFDKKDTRKGGSPSFQKDKLVFKPMRFKIGGKEVWIDPETEYDYKIIQVDVNNYRSNNNFSSYSTKSISSYFENYFNDYFTEFNDNFNKYIDGIDTNIKKNFNKRFNDHFNKNFKSSIIDNIKSDTTSSSRGSVSNTPPTQNNFNDINYSFNNTFSNPKPSNIPFSKGRYGDGDEDNPQNYGYIERRKVHEFDTDKFYIIEAIKKESNTTEVGGVSGDGGGFYKLPAALGFMSKLIKLGVKIFTKLIPEISKLISLLNNPAQFVIDIITQKIKDPISGFSFFTDESMKILGDLPSLSSKVKEGLMEVDELIDIVKNSSLKNYIHVDQLGDWKFLLNGEGTTDFLGILFGIKVDFMSTTPIKPIIDDKGFGTFGSQFNTKCGEDNIPKRPTQKSDINTKKLNNKNTEAINSISNDSYYEEISVKYSTGEKIEGVNYKYIYIDQEMTRLISEADELANLEKKSLDNKPEQLSANLEEALRKYTEALEKERGKDAVDRNESLITMLMGKITDLRKKLNIIIQPIFKLLFGLVTMPLKLVLKIINCILDFLKSLLKNPLSIPSKVAEFLTFKWLTKLFKPAGLLYLAGIDFSPEKIGMWSAAIAGKIDLKDIPLADLKDFLFSAYQMVLPEFTEKQFKDLGDKPFRILVPTLTLFQMVINAVIMLIWSIFGISSVLPPPLMCNKYDINDSDLSDLLSGLFNDKKKDGSGDSYTFIYEVKMGDGTVRRLNAEELQKFIEENKDTNFDFNNFKTIE